MRPTLAIAATIAFAGCPTLAFAQFPPPGIYRCTTATGAPLGTLSLFAAGDYQFSVADGPDYKEKAGDPGNGKGQITSASTSITAQSGPLASVFHWRGTFKTDAHKQHASFSFTGADGSIATCGAK